MAEALARAEVPVAFAEGIDAEVDRALAGAREGDAGRVDASAVPFVVIDPEGARDHDDAVWCGPGPHGGWRIEVAIADVGAVVAPGSALDAAIAARGTSVYLPDRCVAMCPEAITERACSLAPGRRMRALVTTLDVDGAGRVRVPAPPMRPAWVRIARSMTYAEAERGAGGLSALAECAAALRARRAREGAVILSVNAETPVGRDAEGRPAIAPRGRARASERWIEEAMLAANTAGAEWLHAHRAAGAVYRVHPAPGPEREGLAWASALETGLVGGRGGPRKGWIHTITGANAPEGRALWAEQVARSAMEKALYTRAPALHFGLANPCYAHTTSPIRRYSDLRCQQAAHVLHRTPGAHTPQGTGEALCATLNAAERRAIACEREAAQRWNALAVERDPPQGWHDATIMGVADFGLFCESEAVPGMQAMIHVSELGGWCEREGQATMRSDTGRMWRGGQRVRMKVTGADPWNGRIGAIMRG